MRLRASSRWLNVEAYEIALSPISDSRVPIASFSNDDPGGRERAGDLGWVHRRMPGLPLYLQTAFLLKTGEVAAPTPQNFSSSPLPDNVTPEPPST
mgnify:CR=1 FL=1